MSRCIKQGVPQGSALEPTLFLIYINNVSEGLTSSIRLFVDDARMHLSFSIPRAKTTFQRNLNTLRDWANRLIALLSHLGDPLVAVLAIVLGWDFVERG